MTKNDNHEAARKTVNEFFETIVRPLTRTVMRFGYSAREAADVIQWSFVKCFFETPEFWQNGHPTMQHGAIKTGLPRARVKILRLIPDPEAVVFTQRQNLAYRVIEGWVNDPEFHKDDRPAPLPMRHQHGPTFNKLVMKYGTDVNIYPVLADLKAVGCIKVEDDVVTLVSQTYGLEYLDEEKLRVTAYMLRRLAETTDHNVSDRNASERRLQRYWWHVLVPAEKIAELTREISERSVKHGREMDALIASYAHGEPVTGQEYEEVGLGMYIYKDKTRIENGMIVGNTQPKE